MTATAFAIAHFQPVAPSGRTLPTHHVLNIDDLGTSKQIGVADVRLRDGCVYIDDGDTSWLVVWPTGTTLDESANPPVVRNARGQKIVAVDEVFRMRGASYQVSEIGRIRQYLDTEIAAQCMTGDLLLAAADVSALQPAPATWRIDPGHGFTDNSTEVQLLIRENYCAAGRTPYDRVETPQIEYRRNAVLITISVRVIGGACRNPEYPLPITLREPLGNRALIDGSTSEVRWQPPS